MASDDNRPQYQHGVGTINGTQFYWGSGTPGKYWSLPYGDYPVTPDAPKGAWAQSAGAIPLSNNIIPDPLLHRNRVGIMIHSGSAPALDQLYTMGCFKVDPQDWPNVRSQILAESAKSPLYLHIAPGGVAAFTHTKTLQQAGAPPADESSATTPSAVAASAAARGQPFFDALANIESNNQNIFSGVDKDYPGQPGSRSQGYFQIDVPTWQQFGAKAGIDLSKYPTPMNAPRDVQQSVAALIPFSRFGARTQRMLGQQFGALDTSKTIGELAGAPPQGGGATAAAPSTPGTTLTSTPTALGGGGGAVLPGFPDAKTSNQFVGSLQNASKALSGQSDQQGGGGDEWLKPLPIAQPMPPRNVSPLFGMNADQALQAVRARMMAGVPQGALEPVSWSSAPLGQGQPIMSMLGGPQIAGQNVAPTTPYGTSLASLQGLQAYMNPVDMPQVQVPPMGYGTTLGGGYFG